MLARALLLLALAGAALGAVQRTYYIAADKVLWDFAPLGQDECDGAPFNDQTGLYSTRLNGTVGIGSKYLMSIFQEYTDGSFQTVKQRPPQEEHLGILGPILRAAGGDELLVVFRNNHDGLTYNFNPSGATVNDTKGAEPGETKVYLLSVPFASAPGANDVASSKLWLYRSTVDVVGDANSGLLGPLIVTKPQLADASGRPTDVDGELIVVLQVLNQNANPMLNNTMQLWNISDPYAGLSPDDFTESGKKHAINGQLYCNLPGLNLAYGKKTRWYVGVEGNEVDLHNAHWHGHTLLSQGYNSDQYTLLAGGVRALDMTPDNPGVWLFHCHVNDHISAGMLALYNVTGPPQAHAKLAPGGQVRNYYVAADEVVWDYAPAGGNLCGRGAEEAAFSDFEDDENTYMANGTYSLGRRHLKAQFVEYTDASFTVKKNRTDDEAYLGILGPILRATVGDTLNITFKNQLSAFNASMHPHGVFYAKHSEGAPYNDNATPYERLGSHVAPGGVWNYVWEVAERAGPGPSDPSSLMWMYHSHFNEITDVNAGLSGAIIVSRKEVANPDGSPKDVKREFVLAVEILDEVASFYFQENIDQFQPDMNATVLNDLLLDADDAEGEHFHAINGMLFCNLPRMHAVQGERVRFHIYSLGTENGFHAPGVYSTQLTDDNLRKESLQIIPGGMRSSDTILQNNGTFLVADRSADHFKAGQQALLEVAPAGDGQVSSFSSGRTRTYFIQAEEQMWSYINNGEYVDLCTGENMTDDQLLYVDADEASLGHLYHKAFYRGYTDANFTEQLPYSPEMGIQGPLLEAQVGDLLSITFRNALDFAVNLQLGAGVLPTPASFGSGPVAPNATVTYLWKVPQEAGPTYQAYGRNGDLSAVGYTYRSTVDPEGHNNAGLVGAILITNQGAPNTNRRNVPLLFNIQNENLSVLLKKNMAAVGKADADPTNADFVEGNKKHAINGYLFCHHPKIVLAQQSLVRLVFVGVGGETDMHQPIFTNQLLNTAQDGSAYTVQLYQGSVRTADFVPGAPGVWEFNCNVQDHIEGGMKAILAVAPRVGQMDLNVLPAYRKALL